MDTSDTDSHISDDMFAEEAIDQHYHFFNIIHDTPYIKTELSYVRCNRCNRMLWEFDYTIDDEGFLHCQRTYPTEFIEKCLRADLTVEELYARRRVLNMKFTEDAYFHPALYPKSFCDYDVCWKCYWKMTKLKPNNIIIQCKEI
jgi:hypothetical protein